MAPVVDSECFVVVGGDGLSEGEKGIMKSSRFMGSGIVSAAVVGVLLEDWSVKRSWAMPLIPGTVVSLVARLVEP
jgi:hypothetical protein